MSSRILVLHGPPLAFLLDLPAVDRALQQQAQKLGVELRTCTASGEAALLDELLRQRAWLDGVLVNPGSLAPVAHALADALQALGKPAVEVLLEHESKHARGRSALRQVVDKQFHGQGVDGYSRALEALAVARPTAVKTLGPREVPLAGEPAARPSRKAAKTIGRQPQGDATTTAPTKTLGKADAPRADAPLPSPGGGLSRQEVRQRVLDRLQGRLEPGALAAWARQQWVAVTGGAPVEEGAREVLEDVLLTLAGSTAASDHVLLALVAKLER